MAFDVKAFKAKVAGAEERVKETRESFVVVARKAHDKIESIPHSREVAKDLYDRVMPTAKETGFKLKVSKRPGAPIY